MLGTSLYIAYLVANLGLLVLGLNLLGRSRSRSGIACLLLVSLALVFDTAVVLSGHLLGEGTVLAQLNWSRFLLGDLAVPLFVMPVVELSRRAGIGWLSRVPAWPTAVILMGLGLAFEMASLRLVPDPRQGVLRYSAVNPALPYAAIVVTLLALALGWSLWRRRGYAVLLATSLVTLAVSAFPIALVGVAPESAAEVLFIGGFYVTYAWAGGALPERPAVEIR